MSRVLTFPLPRAGRPAPPRRRKPRSGAAAAPLALGLALTVGPAAAHAEEGSCEPPSGLSTCVAADNLWPQAGPSPWLTIAPTTLTEPGLVGFGLVLTLLSRPIVLRVASPDPEGTDIYAVDDRLAGTFQATVGVADGLQLTLAMPLVLYQNGATIADVIGSSDFLPRSAMGDVRFGAAVRLLERAAGEDGVALASRFELSLPTGDEEAFVTSGSPVWAPGASLDHRIGRFSWGVDLSGRIAKERELGGATLGSQLGTALGAQLDILADGWLSAGLEAFALFTLAEQSDLVWDEATLSRSREDNAALHAPAEWLLSVRTAGLLDGQLVLALAGGSFIPTGSESPVTAPRFRFALSAQYVPAAAEP